MDSVTAQKILRREGWCPIHLIAKLAQNIPTNAAANIYGIDEWYCPKCREEEAEKRHAEFTEALAYLRRYKGGDVSTVRCCWNCSWSPPPDRPLPVGACPNCKAITWPAVQADGG